MPQLNTVTEHSDWPIFICYRQADGHSAARFVYLSLHDAVLPFTPDGYSAPPPTSTYFDQTAPAVSDWTAVHAPALQRARTFIFICTPGAYSRLDDEDWVYRELDWWLEHRQTAPILITTHGDRWVPRELQRRWPNAQRLVIDVDQMPPATDPRYNDLRFQLRDRILEGIRGSAVQVLYEVVEREKARTKQLVWQRRLLAGLLMIAILLTSLALWAFVRSRQSEAQARKSQRDTLIESAQRLISQAAVLQKDHRTYAAGAVYLHALETVSSAPRSAEIEKVRQRIWNLFRYLDLRPTKFLEGHIEAVQDIDVSHDGKLAVTSGGNWSRPGMLATQSQDDTLRLWDLRSNRQLAVLAGHKAGIVRVRFNFQLTAIVSASVDGSIKIWDLPSRTLRCEISNPLFAINPETANFTPDGQAIFVVPEKEKIGSLWWWSAKDCSRLAAPDPATPEATILSLAVGGPLLWTEKIPSQVVIAKWDARTAYSPTPFEYEVWAAALSPSGTLAAVAPGSSHTVLPDCSVILWDPASGKEIYRLAGHKNHVRAIAFSSDGQSFASGDEDGIIAIWDLATGKELLRLEGHAGAIRALKFVPDGSLLSGSTDRTLRRWSLPRKPKELDRAGRPFRVAVTKDGKYRFESNGRELVRRSSASDAVLNRISGSFSGVAASPVSPLIVTEEDLYRLVVRDATSLAVVRTLKGPLNPFDDLVVGGLHPVVASSGIENPEIQIWDVETGKRLNRIERHNAGKMAMNPSGRLIVAAYNAKSIRFWDTATGRVQGEYTIEGEARKREEGVSDTVNVTASSDGGVMFFTTPDGMVVAWDVANKKALAARLFRLNNSELINLRLLRLRPSAILLDETTAAVAVKSEIYIWDIKSNNILTSWTASKFIEDLAPGKDRRTFVGTTDRLGLLEWELPMLEVPLNVPDDKAALARYHDLVGMEISDVTHYGRDVSPRIVEPSESRLAAMLDDGDTNTQILALSLLVRGRENHPLLFNRVKQRLGSPEARIRKAAVMVLSRQGAFKEAEAASAIASVLLDNDAEVRTSALLSIVDFGSAASSAIPQLRQLLDKVDDYSEGLGAHISPRDYACDALGNIGSAAAVVVPDLIRVVTAPVPAPQRPPARCARALGEIGDARPEVLDALLSVLGSPEKNMHLQAAAALGKLGVASPQVIRALETAAKRNPESVVITDALERLRGDNVH